MQNSKLFIPRKKKRTTVAFIPFLQCETSVISDWKFSYQNANAVILGVPAGKRKALLVLGSSDVQQEEKIDGVGHQHGGRYEVEEVRGLWPAYPAGVWGDARKC